MNRVLFKKKARLFVGLGVVVGALVTFFALQDNRAHAGPASALEIAMTAAAQSQSDVEIEGFGSSFAFNVACTGGAAILSGTEPFQSIYCQNSSATAIKLGGSVSNANTSSVTVCNDAACLDNFSVTAAVQAGALYCHGAATLNCLAVR